MQYVKDMKCPYCGSDLILDDIDYNFSGNQDEYYVCSHCKKSFIYKIRFGKIFKRVADENEGGVFKEYGVMKNVF